MKEKNNTWLTHLSTVVVVITIVGTSLKIYQKLDKVDDKVKVGFERLKTISDSLYDTKANLQVLQNQVKTENVKNATVIKYINDPALTKKIEEQTEIIRQFTEEVKKNGLSSDLKTQYNYNGSTQ